jgi:hypothetical protein
MPSEPQPENLSAEELQKLSSELSELSRQHAKALEDDVFMGLTKERIAEFERRRNRISELCETVGKANYSDPKPSNTELRHYRLPLLRSQMWQIKSAAVPTAATVRPSLLFLAGLLTLAAPRARPHRLPFLVVECT